MINQKQVKCLISGGCGFVGHHLVEHILKNTNWDIVILDKLSYSSSGFDRLRDISVFDAKRVKVFAADFTKEIKDGLAKEIGEIDYIIHMGAESDVNRSIKNPEPFVLSNVLGTMRMLDFARKIKNLKWFVQFGTDEVFGPAPKNVYYKEWDRYNSSNPYAATKAGAEELCLAYANTYKLPLFIVHSMNIFGERQHPEKFIPMTVKNILQGKEIIIHSNKDKTESGTRCWIHGRSVASALMFLLEKAEQREKYNIVGEEYSNLEIAKIIAEVIEKELHYNMVDFHSERPGHDLRYALDGNKLKEIGFEYKLDTKESLKRTIEWMVEEENRKWLNL